MTVEKTIPKWLLRPLGTGAKSTTIQSEFLAITCNLLKAREKLRVQGAIGFGFAFYSTKNWREIFKPITSCSNPNGVISFENHLKTALIDSNNTKDFKPLLPRPGLGRKFESPMFGCFLERQTLMWTPQTIKPFIWETKTTINKENSLFSKNRAANRATSFPPQRKSPENEVASRGLRESSLDSQLYPSSTQKFNLSWVANEYSVELQKTRASSWDRRLTFKRDWR